MLGQGVCCVGTFRLLATVSDIQMPRKVSGISLFVRITSDMFAGESIGAGSCDIPVINAAVCALIANQ